MGKSKGPQENSKKAAGNAKKAEQAEKKRQEEAAKEAAAEDAEWAKGAKGASKKDLENQKKADAAKKKAERDAMLKEEEASLPSKSVNSKQRGQEKVANRHQNKIDDFVSDKGSTLSATGIDDALDAMEISTGVGGNKKEIDRHPERRFKAAYAAYEERRLPEKRKEHPGLRLGQYKELLRKEFEKSEENPFNQVTARYNASQDEIAQQKDSIKRTNEARLSKE